MDARLRLEVADHRCARHPAGGAVGTPLAPLLVVAGLVAASALLRPEWPELAMVIGIGGLMLQASREDAAGREWIGQSWVFTKQIMPLLLGGVMVAGMLLGRPGHEGLIPSQWVVWAVG